MLKEMPKEYMKEFESSMKMGLIATIGQNKVPHITLIASLQANTPKQMIWGQFIEGLSKVNVKSNPKTGFLIINSNKELWRGKAIWTHEEKEGPEYEMYNSKPLYRYNSYNGIHTVHYMDLVEISEKEKLNIGAIGLGAVLTKIAKGGKITNKKFRILKPWAEELFNKIDSLKFISHLDEDGFPVIIPIIQAQTADSSRIVFSQNPYGGELSKIKAGKTISILGLKVSCENVLVIAKFKGFERCRGVNLGIADIEKVYNSMPPKHGYIYPEEKLEAITEF